MAGKARIMGLEYSGITVGGKGIAPTLHIHHAYFIDGSDLDSIRRRQCLKMDAGEVDTLH